MTIKNLNIKDQEDVSIRKFLNDSQWEAVKFGEGPLLVLAGAGSGKTRVITYRICYLIKNLGIQPHNILAVTFTNKAASEMKKRIDDLLGTNAKGMWISTFHSTCVRILRRYIDRLGISNNFQIFDADDQLKVMKKCFESASHIDTGNLRPNSVLSAISKAKNDLVSLEDYKKWANSPFKRIISEFYQMYEEALRQQSGLDFDDLILMTVKLFRNHNDILEYYQNLWQYILVDEYQDTNLAQSSLIDMLAEKNKNLCVVGDDDQSIYKWRGAEVNNILGFEKRYQGARIIRLEQNYRSTKKILNAAEAVIKKNLKRKGKSLWTDNDMGEPVTIYNASDEHAEASFIAQKARELIRQGEFKDYSAFSILYRVNAQSRVLEEELRKDNIPYVIIGGIRFYERMEIKDCLAYLRVINNIKDDVSITRIINSPPRGIGKGTIDKMTAIAQKKGLSIFETIEMEIEDGEDMPARILNALESFCLLIKNIQAFSQDAGATEILERILDKTKYLSYLTKEQNEEALAREENVKELISATKDFETTTGDRSLAGFLDYVSLLTDIDTYRGDKGSVTLMTLHSAKGLEFPVVFITGIEQGLIPHERSLTSEEELEEERRLFYVGMTRAKKQLFLTTAFERSLFGFTRTNKASVFLNDIPSEVLTSESKTIGKIINSRPEKVIAQPKKAFSASKPIHKVSSSKLKKGRPPKRTEPEPIPADYKFSGIKAKPEDLAEGIIIFHPQWGHGKITQTEGKGEMMKLIVDFRGIKKKLLMRYANLMIPS